MPEPAVPAGHRRRWLPLALYGLLVVAPLVMVAVRSAFLAQPAGTVLEIEMRATGGTAAQLFWSQDWAFYHERSTTLALHQHPGQFEVLRFPLPDRGLEHLRFDPMDGAGVVEIRAVRLRDRQGRLVRSIDPLQFTPLYEIAEQSHVTDQVRIVTEPNATDPALLLNAATLTSPPRWYGLSLVTPFWLAWITLASLALLGSAIGCVVREMAGGPIAPRQVLWFAALFVTVVGAKLLLLQEHPMPVPFWDQWDGEGLSLYLPYANETLGWRQMFALHNEHRIFFTRLLALDLVAINRQWDPHLQIAVNALLHATAATVLAATSWLAVGRRWLPLIAATVLLAVSAPFAIENSLAGFQSAFYFLVLFTVLALWLMTSREPGSPAWVLGWLCALASLFTVAGGVLIAAALAVAAGLRLAGAPDRWRRSLLELAAIGALAAIGYAALPPALAGHEGLKAGTPGALVYALAHNLAFPWIERLGVAGALWLPVAVLTVAVLGRRLRTSLSDRWTLALAAWIVAQAAAIAYSRGVGGTPPASRYLDMLALGLVANLLALLAVAAGRRLTRPGVGWLAGLVWVVVVALGVSHLSARMLRVEAVQRSQWMRQYVSNVGRFVYSGDLDWFLALRGPQQIPYSRPPLLGGMLTHPYIRSLLPAAVRAPIAMAPVAQDQPSFGRAHAAVDAAPIWASYAETPGTRTFASSPGRCTGFPFLAVPVAGDVGDESLRLVVRPEDGADDEVRVPAGRAGWTTAVLRCPAGRFTLAAVDASPTAWFAFKEPVELGWASAVTERLVARAGLILLVGLGLCGAAAALSLTAADRPRAEVPS